MEIDIMKLLVGSQIGRDEWHALDSRLERIAQSNRRCACEVLSRRRVPWCT